MAEHITLEQSAQLYLAGGGIPGDLWNSVSAVQMNLHDTKDWPDIKPLETYAGYLRNAKFEWNKALAEAVIAGSDTGAVAKFDAIIEKINYAIGGGVTSQDQVDTLDTLLDDIRELIYGRRKTPRA